MDAERSIETLRGLSVVLVRERSRFEDVESDSKIFVDEVRSTGAVLTAFYHEVDRLRREIREADNRFREMVVKEWRELMVSET